MVLVAEPGPAPAAGRAETHSVQVVRSVDEAVSAAALALARSGVAETSSHVDLAQVIEKGLDDTSRQRAERGITVHRTDCSVITKMREEGLVKPEVFIDKPIDPEQLIEEVKGLIGT